MNRSPLGHGETKRPAPAFAFHDPHDRAAPPAAVGCDGRVHLIALARHGIGIVGPPPLAIALARTVVIELVRNAEPWALAIQVAGPPAEAAWLARLSGVISGAPLPPGIALAVRVANGTAPVGAVLVAEREADLGPLPAAVLRIGGDAVELDRRDGAAPLPIAPVFTDRDGAADWARGRVGRGLDAA